MQPLQGVAEPTTAINGELLNGSLMWGQSITENPALGGTEIWEIYNATEDAHPVHVHLVSFEVMNREGFSATVVEQQTVELNGAQGTGYHLEGISMNGNTYGSFVSEETRRDMVIVLPGEVTRIKMAFEKPGCFVRHRHILSHEDHEMMRPYYVGPFV